MVEADGSSGTAAGGPERGAVAAVVGALSADIAAGRLAAGARLTEAALAARFGLSRGPVREALRDLAALGLVRHHRHRGAEVRRLTRAEVAALYELREVTEGLAARRAAARLALDAPARARLAEAFGALAAAALARDAAAFGTSNAAFHALLLELAGNPYLTETMERLRLPALRTQFRLLEDPGAIAESQAAHAAIAEAVMAGDPIAAEAAMRAHVQAAGRRLQALSDDAFG